MPTVGHSVKFKFGTQQEFNAITSKDNDTLYFTTDTLILYQGSKRYSKRTKYGTTSPDGSVEGVEGDLYIRVGGDVATGVPFWYYNGTSWIELFHAQLNLGFIPPKTVNGTGDGEDVKTTIRLVETDGSVDKTPIMINSLINSGFDVKLVLSHGRVSSSVSGPITLDYYAGATSIYAMFSGLYVESGSVVAVYSTVDSTKKVTTVTNSFTTVVDSELNDSSINPVQNKIIKEYVDKGDDVKVTITRTGTEGSYSYSADKSYSDIISLIQSGKNVYAYLAWNNGLMQSYNVNDSLPAVVFYRFTLKSTYTLFINSLNEVSEVSLEHSFLSYAEQSLQESEKSQARLNIDVMSSQEVSDAIQNAHVSVEESMSDTSTNPVQNKVIKKYVDDHTVVDSTLSDTSTHPVQNKVIKSALVNKSSVVVKTWSAADFS